ASARRTASRTASDSLVPRSRAHARSSSGSTTRFFRTSRLTALVLTTHFPDRLYTWADHCSDAIGRGDDLERLSVLPVLSRRQQPGNASVHTCAVAQRLSNALWPPNPVRERRYRFHRLARPKSLHLNVKRLDRLTWLFEILVMPSAREQVVDAAGSDAADAPPARPRLTRGLKAGRLKHRWVIPTISHMPDAQRDAATRLSQLRSR